MTARRPLEKVASLVATQPDLRPFHAGEFMYMAAVHASRPKVRIHLYKHVDTRRYLNLDDAGHTYAYVPRLDDPELDTSGGRYRRHSNPTEAVEHLELHLFETARLFRSFPPADWPAAS